MLREHVLIFRILSHCCQKHLSTTRKRPELRLTLLRIFLPWPQHLGLEILFVEWGWGNEPKWISGLPELTILMQIQQLAMPQLWKLEKIPHIRWWERLVGKITSILLLSFCHLVTQLITLRADLNSVGYKLQKGNLPINSN